VAIEHAIEFDYERQVAERPRTVETKLGSGSCGGDAG
jgi:hypothetical protein